MNRLALALLATTAALSAATARADTRVSFGLSIGVPAYRPAPPTVVYAPAPVVHAAARGYWKDVTVKVWVPEHTYIRHNRWGRPERVIEPGYYTYRTDRVWVADDHCGTPPPAPAYSYNHRGHDYSYGWNRR